MFFRLWTRKEACIKALGGSMAHGLSQMVIKDLDQGMTQIDCLDPEQVARRLQVYRLDLEPGYTGSLAIVAEELIPPLSLEYWHWDGHKIHARQGNLEPGP
ncbi:MAG: 4-phosphopantetheinyl transferase family protein [Acaryochloridaceae cyanobacterium CSU_5_19]|nr:4-phosphopantetheinyl transferase family protein [Acaryochloridaceae cyanobacterium CSU_5_19]